MKYIYHYIYHYILTIVSYSNHSYSVNHLYIIYATCLPTPRLHGRLKVIAQARRTSCDLGCLPPNFPSPSFSRVINKSIHKTRTLPSSNLLQLYNSKLQFQLNSPPSPSPLLPLNQIISSPLPSMASRTLSRALRSPLAKQLSAPARRTFVSAINASARPTARTVAAASQQVRGVKTIDFAGVKEDVYGMFC